jgi:uncharacterized protein (DUF58 family)
MRFLDPVALSQLGTLALKARTIVEGALTGLHRSPHHGSSVEFAEHKEYSPGDEVRHIDWKAYGKFDRYYVKRFEEETELWAYLLFDRSGSMAYQGQGLSKLTYAAYLVASLAYLLIRQKDRVGLLAFGGTELTYVPPRGRSSHLHDLLGTLERIASEDGRGKAGLGAALDSIAETSRRRRSLVVVVSDFLDSEVDVWSRLLRLRVQGHDVVVFHVLDPDELELPFEGLTMFQSLEDETRLLVDPHAVRGAYLAELRRYLDGMKRTCAEGRIEYQLLSTAQPLSKALLDFLTARAGRVKRANRAR